MKTMAKRHWPEVSYEMKAAMNSPESVPAFRERLLSLGLEKAADMLDRYHDSLFNYTSFPRQYWRRLRTTNMLERINLELKRRTRKVGAFPGEQSLLRLTVSILMDINEEWMTGRKYLSLEDS
ncbi:MAG: transposase [Thermoplasmata archaeon]|nr:transposase [Candidatus Sysuiplasma acidicola]